MLRNLANKRILVRCITRCYTTPINSDLQGFTTKERHDFLLDRERIRCESNSEIKRSYAWWTAVTIVLTGAWVIKPIIRQRASFAESDKDPDSFELTVRT